MTDGLEPIILYGTSWCPDCWRTRRFLEEHDIEFQWVDIDGDKNANEYVRGINGGCRSVPTVLFLDGSTLTEPSNQQMALKLGIDI